MVLVPIVWYGHARRKKDTTMPNMRKTNKRQLNLSVTLELWHKCDKYRERICKPHVSDAAIVLLEDATRDIELTSTDYETIKQETAENERKRKQK